MIKIMTQEEKARAYDEALEVMRQWIAPCYTKEQLDTLKKSVFPELAESDDEKIRKNLIDHVQRMSDTSTYFTTGIPKERYIAWLEKQKEPDNEEGDFTIYHPQKNGDGKYQCIPFSFYGSLTSFTNDKDLMDFLNESFYDKEECEWWCEMVNKSEFPECKHIIKKDSYIDYLCESSSDEKQKERGPLTKEEEYILHRIIEYLEDETCPSEWISLLHDIYCLPYEKQKEQKPADLPPGFYFIDLDGKKYYSKEFRFGDMKMKIVEDKSEKPAEWSEEDEKKLERVDDLLWMLDDYLGNDCSICEEETARLRDEIHNELFPWLEFLRPQYHGDVTMTEAYKMGKEAGEASHWKPSEVQTAALNSLLCHGDFSYIGQAQTLQSLYIDLMKL